MSRTSSAKDRGREKYHIVIKLQQKGLKGLSDGLFGGSQP